MLLIADPALYKEKEELYIKVRDAEGRIISDDVLRDLPLLPDNNPHAGEWVVRRDSLQRFNAYLRKRYRGRKLNILDVGCGNGWMTHRLFKNGHTLTGVDLNTAELEQAERVFSTEDNLTWVYADVMKDIIPGAPFDVILFSASCQYFSSISELTNEVKSILSPDGEIHLLDSVFYNTSRIYEAKGRSVDYYSSLGFPLMSRYYFHHTIEELKSCGYTKLRPGLFVFKRTLQWWVYRMARR